MPYCLKLAVLSEVEQTIYPGIEGQVEIIGLSHSESAERIGELSYRPLESCVVILSGIGEVPVHSVAYSRGSLDISEHREGRKSDVEAVLHSVTHLLEEVGLSHL